ncbi:MAG: NAD(P)-binding protein [Acidimicrobiales bacterium]|nr:NAD(P)-binding protein [Acidimicrobiales bacterium]
MERHDVAVIGGGLAGWAAAATAARAGSTVVVVDRDGVGGRAATDRVGRFLFNRGAHALYDRGPGAAVLRSLGIEPRGGRPPVRGWHARGAFVVHVMRYLRSDETSSPDRGRRALEEHLGLAGVAPETIAEARYLHRMTVTSSMPVPENGGMAGRPSITSTGDDRILVAGDWIGPEGNLADASLTSGAAAGHLAARRASPTVAS